jgi:uncharacterized protein (TIGR00251 family)
MSEPTREDGGSHRSPLYTPAVAGRSELVLDPEQTWCRQDGDGWLLAVRVQPNSSVSAIAGEHAGQLKVRLAAPPVDGKANAELVRLLARALGVPRASVSVVRGRSSRSKTVRIAHVTGP